MLKIQRRSPNTEKCKKYREDLKKKLKKDREDIDIQRNVKIQYGSPNTEE